jgi:SAM-dependent methyltransferase
LVRDGIVDLASDPSSAAVQEIKGNRLMVAVDRAGCDDQWLLGLPWSHATLRPQCADHDEMSDWNAIRANVELRKGDVLLDLGAGTCWTTEQWALAGAHAIASDISLEKFIGLRSAEVLIRERGNWFERVRFDMNGRWPFGSSSIDVVVAMSSIHHGDSLEHSFSEGARVMKATGTLLLVEATRSILVNANATDFGRREIEEFHLNEHIYSQLEFRRSARRAGLKLRFLPAGSFVRKLEMIASGSGFRGRTALKHRIAYRLRPLLATKAVKSLMAGPMFPLLNAVAGTQFVGVATRSRV